MDCFIQWTAIIHFGGQIVLDLASGTLQAVSYLLTCP